MIKNYYQILGLTDNCSKDDIRKAYRLYAKKFHPDKQDNDSFFEEKFKEIKCAYDILIDDNKRATFDSQYSNSKKEKYSNVENDDTIESQVKIMARKLREKEEKEQAKRKIIYYTSKDLILNGLYVYHNKKSYKLVDYDRADIRKNDDSQYGCIGIFMILIGILTVAFFIGIPLILLGIGLLFYKDYFVILISKKGETLLIKGTKSKTKKISKLIDKAIVNSNR